TGVLDFVSEYVLNHAPEGVGCERLPHTSVAGRVVAYEPLDLFRRVARHEDDLGLRGKLLDAFGEFDAVEAGHHHVEQGEINRRPAGFKKRESLHSSGSREDLVSALTQRSAAEV